MPNARLGRRSTGSGAAFLLGPPTNTFGLRTGTLQNAIDARNNYAGANAAWLAAYDAKDSLFVRLLHTGGATYQSRIGGVWTTQVGLAQGDRGPQGNQGAPGQGVPTGGDADDFMVKSGPGDFASGWRPLRESDIPAGIARDAEVAAAIARLVDGAAGDRDTLRELADAISAIVPGATWTTGSDPPAGGSDGDWYLRTGNVQPGIYYRSGGVWILVMAPGVDTGLPAPPPGPGDYILKIAADGGRSWAEAQQGSGPGPAPSDTQNHCGTSDDTAISTTELAAATSGAENALAVPAYAGRRHVWFLRPAAAGAVSSVYLYESGHRNTSNQSSAFDAVDVTLSGTRYLGVISKVILAAAPNTIMEVA